MSAWNVANVLVPLDGSAIGDDALELALPIVKQTGARLHLVYVQEMPQNPKMAEQDRDYMASVEKRVAERLPPKAVTSALLSDRIDRVTFAFPPRGTVAEILGRYADENAIDLIVMTTHGRGGFSRAWLGSVADSLIRHAHVPVLLHPSSGGPPGPFQFQRILIPLDGSERAEGVIAAAVALGRLHHARITLLSVVAFFSLPPGVHPAAFITAQAEVMARDRQEAESYLNALADRLGGAGVSVSVEVIEALDVAGAIVRFAHEHGHDAIAIGTRGIGGGKRLMLGSVADKIIRTVQLPVLVLNPASDSRDEASTL
jgi:nucleotide-binding universal stress UspA family protein